MLNRRMLDRTYAATVIIGGLLMAGTILYATAWFAEYEFNRNSYFNHIEGPSFWDVTSVLAGLEVSRIPLFVLFILCMLSGIIVLCCLSFVDSVVTPVYKSATARLTIQHNRRAHRSAIKARKNERATRLRDRIG